MREGQDCAVFACGALVYEALLAAEELAAQGISLQVTDLHTIKPLDAEAVTEAARRCGAVVTAEEHQVAGGLFGAVSELLAAPARCPWRPWPSRTPLGRAAPGGPHGPVRPGCCRHRPGGAGLFGPEGVRPCDVPFPCFYPCVWGCPSCLAANSPWTAWPTEARSQSPLPITPAPRTGSGTPNPPLSGQERYLYDQILPALQNQETEITDLYPDTAMIQKGGHRHRPGLPGTLLVLRHRAD